MKLTLTKKDLSRAANLLLIPSIVTAIISFFIIIIGVMTYKHYPHFEIAFVKTFVATTLFTLVMSGLSLWSRHRYIKQFDESTKLRREMDVEIIDGKLVITQGESKAVYERSDIIKMKSNKYITILFPTSLLTLLFPSDFIKSYPEFNQWITASQTALPVHVKEPQ